jgi:hypothetical protein
MKSLGIALIIARISGLLALAAGTALATGFVAIPVPLHMSLGTLLALSLLLLAGKARKAGEPLLLVIVAATWAIALPVWGSVQTQVFLALPWLSRVIHVICGLSAVGLAEILGMRLMKKAKAG